MLVRTSPRRAARGFAVGHLLEVDVHHVLADRREHVAVRTCACSFDAGVVTTFFYKLPAPPRCEMGTRCGVFSCCSRSVSCSMYSSAVFAVKTTRMPMLRADGSESQRRRSELFWSYGDAYF